MSDRSFGSFREYIMAVMAASRGEGVDERLEPLLPLARVRPEEANVMTPRHATQAELNQLASDAASRLWAMHEPLLKALKARLGAALTMGDAIETHTERLAQMDEHGREYAPAGIAMIPMRGQIMPRSGLWSMFFGGACIDRMQMQFRKALADPSVKAVVFDIDSGGGTVDGVEEFATEILDARGSKPVWAVCNTFCASAAYWIASACDKIVGMPTSQAGSIGVYCVYEDITKMLEMMGISLTLIRAGDNKAEAEGYIPLSDDAKAHLQEGADAMMDLFVRTVAKGRGLSPAIVKGEQFGQGRVYGAKAALKRGIIDQIGTMDMAFDKLAGKRKMSMAASADGAGIVGELKEHHDCVFTGALEAKQDKDADKQAEMVEPEDGKCPEGYELQDDGMCHLMPEDESKAETESAQAQADRDALAIVLALGNE